jgi:FMN phosphatase YigB (HAD superfamily)
MNMKKRVLVLDFDGTLTNAEEEGKPFAKGYKEDLSILLRKKIEEVSVIAQSAEAEIIADPAAHGWKNESDGVIVAPAMADPYLRMQAIAHHAFDKFGLYLNRTDREHLLTLLFMRNYHQSGTVFKDGAGELLFDLYTNSDLATYIVTNSTLEGVFKKILALSKTAGIPELVRLQNNVIGGAKKYVVGNKPEHLVEKITIPGLSRPIYVRRSEYYKVLENLREENNIDWEDMMVIGDIFELDLALPFMLGARVGLVANQFTPQYERDFIASRRVPPAAIINSLDEVLPFVLK